MKRKVLLSTFICSLLISASICAETGTTTTTTTTTTTNPDGSVTTQETTQQTSPETTTTTGSSSPKALGPKGVAGTLRRIERRDDYRKEQDLEELNDALEDRPRTRR